MILASGDVVNSTAANGLAKRNAGHFSPQLRFAALVVVSAMLMVEFVSGNNVSAAENANTFTKSRFYQFFTDPNPSVRKVIFLKEMFSANIPESSRKQIFSLSKTGDDYMLSALAGTNDSAVQFSIGAYKGRAWVFVGVNSQLTVSDPAINTKLTPISAQESATRIAVNGLINLGITEFLRGSLEWDGKNSHFIGKSTSGDDIIITFELTNHLPKRAIILNGAGITQAYVDYEYSNAICNGELPFRFSRHIGSPEHELAHAFQVELLEAEFESNKAVENDLSPANVLHPKETGFYSNGLLYAIQASGKATKVLTVAESQAALAGPKKSFAGRVFVFSAMALGLVALAIFVSRTNKKNNKQQTENI